MNRRNCGTRIASTEAECDDSELHCCVHVGVQLLEQMPRILPEYGRYKLPMVSRWLLRMYRRDVHKLRNQRIQMHTLSFGQGG